MANALKTLFTDIATAIRETLVDVESMKPSSFPDRIREVAQTGGSSDLVKYVTFMSWDGSTELFKMPVLNGDECKDPITHGDIETPTKESTNTENFTYSGWSLTGGGSASDSSLKNVTEDRVVYASYTSSTRYYTVNFYDETALLETVQVTYGADATNLYTPYKDGYIFKEWMPSVANVTEDISTYAQFEIDDKDTWEGITRNIANDTYMDKYPIGYTKELSVPLASGSTGIVTMELVAYDHDDLADGSGKAKTTWLAKETVSYKGSTFVSNAYSTQKTWETCDFRKNLRNTVLSSFPEVLRSAIKSVTKKYSIGTSMHSVADTIWIPSLTEIGCTKDNTSSFINANNSDQGAMYNYRFNTDSTSRDYDSYWGTRSIYEQSSYPNARYLFCVSYNGTVGSPSSQDPVVTLIGFCI